MKLPSPSLALRLTFVAAALVASSPSFAQQEQPQPAPKAETAPASSAAAKAPAAADVDKSGLVRISKEDAVWIHPQRKLVVVDGEVALREGFLELFACPKGTKEHESVVAVYSKAYVIHAGLLAVGAVPGRPVQFQPAYRPAEGPIVDVYVLYHDPNGQRRTVRAQEWVRNTQTQKAMEQDWVFAGSGFWTDEETGQRYYYAEEGDLICVSNFATAMMDVPIESSQANDQLLFEAFTERLPPKGTKVRLVLIPRIKEGAAKEAAPEKKEEIQNPQDARAGKSKT